MKTIYLRDRNYGWDTFEFEDLKDLEADLKQRNISIGNRASIGYDVKLINGFFINGSKNTVTYVGNKKLSIGCVCLKISNWKKNFEKIGKEKKYTESQIKEYKGYIILAEKFIEI